MLLMHHGRGVAVLQSVADFNAAAEEREFMRAVVAGLSDLEAGRGLSAAEAMKRLASADFVPKDFVRLADSAVGIPENARTQLPDVRSIRVSVPISGANALERAKAFPFRPPATVSGRRSRREGAPPYGRLRR